MIYALWIFALFLCGLVIWIFIDHANPFGRRQEAFLLALQSMQAQQLELVERLSESQERVIREVAEVVAGLTAVTKAQADAEKTRLEMLNSANQTPGRSWVMNDEKEHQKWLQEHGFPVNATADAQWQWVQEQAGQPW